MFHILLLGAMLAAASPPPFTVVDEAGNAIAEARITAIGHGDVLVSAPGYEARIVRLTPAVRVIVLRPTLALIASVRVATGSAQTLHTLPVAATAMDRQAIASSAASTSDALLRALPGFDRNRSNSMFSNYGLLRVSFAGAGNDRGLVLVDDIPAQDGFGGQIDWAAYPPQSLERAELLLGAGSALYGAGAVGGVLQMQTFVPPAQAGTPAFAQVRFAVGTHAFSQQSLMASGWAGTRLSAALWTSQQRMQYWDLPPAYSSSIDRQAQSAQAMAALAIRYAFDSRNVVELAQRDAWDDQSEGRENYTFSRRLLQSALRYAHETPNSQVWAALYARTGFITNIADQFPAKPGTLRYVQYVPTNEAGVSASWSVAAPASIFELRADARQIRGESQQFGKGRVFQNAGSGSQSTAGAAVQQTWKGTRYEIVAGARVDAVTSYDELLAAATRPAIKPPAHTDAALSPRIAATFDFDKNLALRLSTGSGFRPPYLNELVRGFFIGSTNYQPSPSLIPERSVTGSAGLDQLIPRGRISLDLFDTTVGNAIMFRTVDFTHQIRSNVARTKTNGYTVTYSHASGACGRVSASFTSQYARVTSGNGGIVGRRLQYVPAQSGSVAYDVTRGEDDVGVTLAYVGPTYADDINAQPLGSALLAGAHVSIPLTGGAALDISADNLTGARYLSSMDRYGTPTVFSLGVSVPVGPGNNHLRGVRCTP